MSSSQELSPEEKLLKVIQEGESVAAGQAAGAGSASVPAPSKPAGRAAVPPSVAPAVAAVAPPPAVPPAAAAAATPEPATPATPKPTAPREVPPPAGQAAPPPPAAPAKPVVAAAPARAPAVSATQAASSAGRPPVAPAPPVAAPATPPSGEAPGAAPSPPPPPPPPRRVAAGTRSGILAIAVLNRCLGVVTLVLLGFVAYSIASVRSDLEDAAVPPRVDGGGGAARRATRGAEGMAPLAALLAKVATRDIFTPGGTTPEGGTNVTVVSFAAAVSNWKLMGISMDSESPAESMAIIRDKSASKTYFLKRGQAIGETGIALERIQADRVALRKDKEELELR